MIHAGVSYRPPARAHTLTALIALAGAQLLAGCSCPPKAEQNGASGAARESTDAAPLIAAHNARAAQLRQIDASGVIEMKWREESRSRSEQGDIELWINQPRQTAIRISKLGEELLWLGSDEHQFWLFDLLDNDRRSLITGTHGQVLRFGSGDGAILLHPLMLLDLLGITQLSPPEGALQSEDAAPEDAHQAVLDAAGSNWLVRATGASAMPLELAFDRNDGGIRRVSVHDAQGRVIATAKHSRFERVVTDIPGSMTAPKMATLIDVTPPKPGWSLKIALEAEIFTDLTDQPVERIFNLSVLRDAFRPHVVNPGDSADDAS